LWPPASLQLPVPCQGAHWRWSEAVAFSLMLSFRFVRQLPGELEPARFLARTNLPGAGGGIVILVLHVLTVKDGAFRPYPEKIYGKNESPKFGKSVFPFPELILPVIFVPCQELIPGIRHAGFWPMGSRGERYDASRRKQKQG